MNAGVIIIHTSYSFNATRKTNLHTLKKKVFSFTSEQENEQKFLIFSFTHARQRPKKESSKKIEKTKESQISKVKTEVKYTSPFFFFSLEEQIRKEKFPSFPLPVYS